MGALATLTLFPPYSLDTSILAAVLLGVVILALFTEAFGWVFVGLVVPGYLASVFVVHKEAGITVVVEAVLTYLVAKLLAAALSRSGAWSQFFGRERFFLIVIASVLVREVGEVWLLPYLGRWLDDRFGTTFTVDRTLHSIGLVLVPLTANAFWKLKLPRGLFQVGVPVLITYALLQWVLLPATNLSFGSLELTYEDVAQRFLASPKAYIILLTTALIAARFNHLYGWDFNGILVPALIALTWLSPLKLLATLAEVVVLVFAARAVLSIPGLKVLNLEGPRKTILVFALGFFLKWALGWALGGRVPGLKVTDLFGFGYLVPTLLAVKMLQKQTISRVLLSTVHTSFAGVAVGTAIGLVLSWVEPASLWKPNEPPAVEQPSRLARTPLGVMTLARAVAHEDLDRAPRRHAELRRYTGLWTLTRRWLEDGEGEEALRKAAHELGLELRRLPYQPGKAIAYALLERTVVGGRQGWDTALLFPGEPGPVLEVPHPLSEPPTAEAAALLCERVRCRAVIASGVDPRGGGEAPSLRSVRAALEEVPRIQVRADPAISAGGPVALGDTGMVAALWPGVSAGQRAPGAEPEGDAADATLTVNPGDLHALVTSRGQKLAPVSEDELWASLGSAGGPAAGFDPPSDAELIVLEQQVAAPLLDGAGFPEGTAAPLRARWADTMAGLLGLQVRPVDGCDCWLVGEANGRRGWLEAGLLVRQGGAQLAVEAPATHREVGTLPFALELWRSTQARALVFADPALPGQSGAVHAASYGVVRTGFQAFHQAVQRALPPQEGLVLQVRGYTGRPVVDAEVVVTLDTPVLEAGQRPAQLVRALEPQGALGWLAPLVRDHDGAAELAGLFDVSTQRRFARTFGGAPVATLWLSEALRGAYVAPRRGDEAVVLSRLSPLPLAPASPEEVLLGGALGAPKGALPRALEDDFAHLGELAARYVTQQGPTHLGALLASPARRPVVQTVRAYRSVRDGLPFLLVEARHGKHRVRGVWFLQQHASPLPAARLEAGEQAREAVRRALRQRAPIVVVGTVAEGMR